MYKIHIHAAAGLYHFRTELNEVLQRRKDGHKGFKRTLFHRTCVEKDTTIEINFKDYVAKPNLDTGLFDVEQLLTVEENMAFLAVIDSVHASALDYVKMDLDYCTLFDMNNAPVSKEVKTKAFENLCKIEFKRHNPENIFLPVIRFSVTDEDWETDKSLWVKLSMISKYLRVFSNTLADKPGVDSLAKAAKSVLVHELSFFNEADELVEDPVAYTDCIAKMMTACNLSKDPV